MNNITKFLKERYWLLLLIAIFIFSFVLDIYVLTRYSLSYGVDGAFYDIQVRNILQIGYPLSNDPPLAYYLLSPFVILTGNSFLGIKIGMALMGSLLAFPAFFLTECYVKGKNLGSKVPALLSAFLITVNINYFAMISDFMQNLVGVLFLVVFLYLALRWFENINNWHKYGVLTVIFLCLNLLTHIYTGALAVLLFFALLIFNIIFKKNKTGQIPLFDLKILGLLTALVLGCFVVLFLVYPVMYSKFATVISFFNASASNGSNLGMRGSPSTGMIFCSFPYLLGVFAALKILYNGLKEKAISPNEMNRNTLLAWLYLSLAVVLAVLSFLPSAEYQSRFVLMAFLPIALLVPLGIKYVENEFLNRYPVHKKALTAIVIMVALIFAFSSYYTAAASFDGLRPTVTSDQYQELVKIKQDYLNNPGGVIVAGDFQTKYWVQYVLGNNVTISEDQNEITTKYANSTIYVITATGNNQALGGFQKSDSYEGSFLLPYGPPILPNSIDKIPTIGTNSQNNFKNPFNNTNQPQNNGTGGPPDNNFIRGNATFSGNNIPGKPNGTMSSPPQGNMTASGNGIPTSNGQGLSLSSLNISGTTIYSGKYFKIVKYNL
ncbi:MAG TPA: glycosyltransferase family 39 protein [Methanobacteriaceae archaeon]|nr:glycosyltransferase family 39 protein [Methanobacteriaceae archaeon]